jgi:uncharacterized membrane protein YdjX (TVP38/TMEM64 family)
MIKDKLLWPFKKISWRLVVGLLIIVIFLSLARFLPLNDWLDTFNNWVKDLGFIGYILFIAVYALAAVLFIPGSVLTLGAGFAFGVIGGLIAVSFGSTLGAALAFLVARYLARDKIQAKLIANAKFKSIDSAIGKKGGKLVLLLRLSPVFPYVWLNYLLGLTAVKFWHYLIASWLGMIPGTILYVYLGYISKAGIEATSGVSGKNTLEYVFIGVGLLITIIVTIYVTSIARKALSNTALQDIAEESI